MALLRQIQQIRTTFDSDKLGCMKQVIYVIGDPRVAPFGASQR